MAELDTAAEAIEETKTTLKSARLAVEAELAASGAPLTEQPEGEREQAWA